MANRSFRGAREFPSVLFHGDITCSDFRFSCLCYLYLVQSARKNALQVIAEYERTPAEAVEVPDLSALRQLYSEKNPAVPTLRCCNRTARSLLLYGKGHI